MDRREFDNLPYIEQVNYINKRIKESNETSKEVCKEIPIGASTITERFRDKIHYVFDRKLKQYVPKQLNEQENIFNDNVETTEEPQNGENETKEINTPIKNEPREMLGDETNNNIVEEIKKTTSVRRGRPQKHLKDEEGKNIDKTKITFEIDEKTIKALKLKKVIEGIKLNEYVEQLLNNNIEPKFFDMAEK